MMPFLGLKPSTGRFYMSTSLPEQCRGCRHLFYRFGNALCNKRMLQKCIHEGDTQKVLMAPGLCYLLNPDNQCAEYAPPRFHRLKKWFKKK
jgi:hypothetical protein